MRLGRKGLEQTKIVILIVSVAVVFLLAMAIRNMAKPGPGENEGAAIVSLKNIDAAMKNWYYSQPSSGYFGVSLSRLAQAYPSYIDSELATGMQGGYTFMLLPISHYEYFCIAAPLSDGVTGTKVFRVTESGTVEVALGENWQPAE